jgi:hypothetical protein
MSEQLPGELQVLLRNYRESLPDPEPSAKFMPELWARIESRRKTTYSFGRLARGFVTAAAGLCLLISGLHWVPLEHSSGYQLTSYVDALNDTQADEEEQEIAGGEAI